MASDDSVRRWITVHDLEGWESPVRAYVCRADVERYLSAQGWRRPSGRHTWWTRGPAADLNAIMAGDDDELAALVSHTAVAEGHGPRALLKAIGAEIDDAPDTERDPHPLFKVVRVQVPREAGIARVTLSLIEGDDYVIWETRREGDTAVITLRRVDPDRSK